MAEGRHRATLDQMDIISLRHPAREPVPCEFRSPSEPANDRLCQFLGDAPPAGFRPDSRDKNDLATRTQDASKLVERRLGVRNRGNDVMRHDDVEGCVREHQILRVHHFEESDIFERKLRHPLSRAAQHRFRQINSDNAIGGRIAGKRYPRANANFENPTTDLFRRRDGRPTSALENGAENEIVNGGPECVCFLDRGMIELSDHSRSHRDSFT